MSIQYREAAKQDVETLVRLRLEFLTSDRGPLSAKETAEITEQLYRYFEEQTGKTFFAVFAIENGEAVSTAYLAVFTRPANPSFMTGKIGTILNVYTKPAYRRQGIAYHVLTLLIEKAKQLEVSRLELAATPMGKPLYQELGFAEKNTAYTDMQLQLQ